MTSTTEVNQSLLIEAIRSILSVGHGTISEYDLIQLLNGQGWDLPTSAADSLALFTSHFLVYNALYQLQAEYWQQQQYLQISALSIQLYPPTNSDDTGSKLSDYQNDESLRDYYLDFKHLQNASEESVNELLNQFWQRFVSSDEVSEALSILNLEAPIDAGQVK